MTLENISVETKPLKNVSEIQQQIIKFWNSIS